MSLHSYDESVPIVDSNHIMLYTVIAAAITTQSTVELPLSQGASTVLWLSQEFLITGAIEKLRDSPFN